VREPRLLARGPARLCQAFGIGRTFDGADLVEGSVWVGGRQKLSADVLESPRIGIKVALDMSWRIYEPGPWAS
jgi:DNA-3-methyladenine glycosylase